MMIALPGFSPNTSLQPSFKKKVGGSCFSVNALGRLLGLKGYSNRGLWLSSIILESQPVGLRIKSLDFLSKGQHPWPLDDRAVSGLFIRKV